MANKRRYWSMIAPMPAEGLSQAAKQLEDLGVEGIWAPQLYSPPFLALSAAAMATSRVKLGTGVALAFTRSPLETACSALDLDRISNGRCVLGIGPSIRWWNEDWYGVPYGKPIPHLRETVDLVRRIIRHGHTGDLGRFDGEYTQVNLDHFRTLAPPVRPDIPVYIPAVYETACRVAGEIADGLPGHPIWCEPWIRDRVAKNVAEGLAKSGRDRKDFDLNVWLFVAPNPDKREAIEDTRQTIAFYAQMRQYERYFAESGFGDEARAVQKAAEAKDESGALRACTDAMVEHFALVGPADEVRRRVDRIAEVTDSFTLAVPFHGVSQEKTLAYNQRIAETFYV